MRWVLTPVAGSIFRHFALTPVAGLIFETKNRAIFSGELFSGEEYLEQLYCPYNFVPIVPINLLWSGFIFPELEHL